MKTKLKNFIVTFSFLLFALSTMLLGVSFLSSPKTVQETVVEQTDAADTGRRLHAYAYTFDGTSPGGEYTDRGGTVSAYYQGWLGIAGSGTDEKTKHSYTKQYDDSSNVYAYMNLKSGYRFLFWIDTGSSNSINLSKSASTLIGDPSDNNQIARVITSNWYVYAVFTKDGITPYIFFNYDSSITAFYSASGTATNYNSYGHNAIKGFYGDIITVTCAKKTGYTLNGVRARGADGSSSVTIPLINGTTQARFFLGGNHLLGGADVAGHDGDLYKYGNVYSASYTPNTYTVTFNANGGTGTTTSSDRKYDTTYDFPTVTRTGYTLLGWSKNSSATSPTYTGTTYRNLTSTDGDKVTLYAVWSENSYTLNLNANGGSVSPTSKTLKYTESYTLPTPSRTGYTFAGWWTSASGGTQKSGSVSKLNSTNGGSYTLYAHWTENSYTLYLDPNGGSVTPTSKVLKYTESYTLPTPTRAFDGYLYSFAGWWTSATGGTQKTGSVSKLSSANNGSYTLYAHWNQYDTWSNHATAPTKGSGSVSSPYQIGSAANLAWLAKNVISGTTYSGQYFIQTANLDLSKYPWIPIGISSTNAFRGNYDGQNYLINNFNSSLVLQSPYGLFGYTVNSYIKNIVLSGAEAKSGVVASNSYSGVVGNGNVGGIVGWASGGTIEHCINFAPVQSNGSSGYVGGIAGYTSNTNIKACANYANVTNSTTGAASIRLGGIVGCHASGSIQNCFSKCTVSSSATGGTFYQGGLVGYTSGLVSGCGFDGTIKYSSSATSAQVYALGYATSSTTAYFKNCFAINTTTPSNGVAGKMKDCLCYCTANNNRVAYRADSNKEKNFAEWVKAAGTKLGFLPKGFAWLASSGISTSESELTKAGFTIV